MKPLLNHGLAVAFLMALLLPISSRAGGSATAEDWNVVVLDQLLASVPAGQPSTQVGDMLLPVSYLQSWRNKLAGVPQPKIAFSGTFTKWTGGNVYYAFDASVSASNQKAFRDATAEWATFANLHFIARASQANYILVTNNASLGGGLSFVGMVGGAQLLQIGPGAWNRGTLCHELGHALGLVHEHQRSDRDGFVTILTNNIVSGHLADFVKLTDSQNKSTYDFLSVMHYARNAFSVDDASNTIQPLATFSQYLNLMGNSDPVLSTDDRAGMAQIYGAGPGATNIVTNTLDGGPGSLRAALYYGFDHPGTTITFNIPVTDAGFSNNVFNIQPSDTFPSLVNATILDGSTEPTNSNPAGPEIVLDGVLCHTPDVYPSGLQFKGTNCVVRSLVINNFPYVGVRITGSNATGNTVSGCYLGIDPTGNFAVTNGVCPAQIDSGASANTIGGLTAAARNIISGGAAQGLLIRDPGTRLNLVQGNYIGLNAAGAAALPNAWAGIEIFGGAQSNLIGGAIAPARNVISGNNYQGILMVDPAAMGNVVAGNYIGLDPSGTTVVSNGWAGVEISGGASGNIIGAGNVISGNGEDGVIISGTSNNVVQGNVIGLNAPGTAAAGNGWAGVDLYFGAQGNVVGTGNVISGNGNDGILLRGDSTVNNMVQGNFIGLNTAGTAAVGNGWAGVDFYYGPQTNLVGGTVPAARNVISGNSHSGILFNGGGTTDNRVQGNFIGLDALGLAAVGNGGAGVEFYFGPQANLIGGGPGARNFISGNDLEGVRLNGTGTTGNWIEGNTLGLDAANHFAVPNFYSGVVAFGGAASNQVGGLGLGLGNLIASNASGGIALYDATTTNNTFRGNSVFGNGGFGIVLFTGANNSLAAPALAAAVVTTNTVVSGSYNGISGAVYQLDFYADAPPAFSAQAMTYLGSAAVAGTGGSAAFAVALGALLPAGRIVTATATDPAGNTSQLSTGIAVTMTSGVNDGIPNAWRARYFGGSGTTTNAASTAGADPDHDGVSNYQEFLAGTNPNDAASVLKLTALNPNASANAVSLDSVSGIVYRVQYRDDLTAGSWNLLADQIVGTGTNIFLPDPTMLLSSKRFYRAQVLW